nr:MAG TPA: hypothetical protein [Microviridae sp.]
MVEFFNSLSPRRFPSPAGSFLFAGLPVYPKRSGATEAEDAQRPSR